MKFTTTLCLSIMCLMTACPGSGSQAKMGDRLLEDPEHNIKDSPEILKHDSTILYTGWYFVVDIDNGFKRQLDKSSDTFFIDPKPIVTAKNFSELEIYESNAGGQKYVGLTMRLDQGGTVNRSVATERSIGKQLAFILDNKLLYVAKVNAQITVGVTALNRGDYSRAELDNFKTIIESER